MFGDMHFSHVVKFLRRRPETLRLKLSRKEKNQPKNCSNALNRETQKTYPGEYKDKKFMRSRQESE